MGSPETFTVYSRTVIAQDADGNDVYDESSRDVRGAFAPASSAENVQAQAQVLTRDTLYLDDGQVAPGAQDEMLVRGIRRKVEGVAAEFRSPFTGWTPGPVVELKTVTG